MLFYWHWDSYLGPTLNLADGQWNPKDCELDVILRMATVPHNRQLPPITTPLPKNRPQSPASSLRWMTYWEVKYVLHFIVNVSIQCLYTGNCIVLIWSALTRSDHTWKIFQSSFWHPRGSIQLIVLYHREFVAMDDVETLIDLDSQENDFCEPTPEPHLGFHVISAGAPSYQHLSPGSWKPAITGEKRDLAEAVAPETPTRTEGDTTQKPAIVQCVKVRRPQ